MAGKSQQRRNWAKYLTRTQAKREARGKRWTRFFSRWLPLSWQGGTPIVSRLVDMCRGWIRGDRARRKAILVASNTQLIGHVEPLEDRRLLNAAPVSIHGGSYDAYLLSGTPQPITLDGSGSYDPDLGDSIASWEWDTNYVGGGFDVDQSGEVVSFADPTWFAGEIRTIALRVTDSLAAQSISQTTINVTLDPPPTITFVEPTAGDAFAGGSMDITFDISDPEGDVIDATYYIGTSDANETNILQPGPQSPALRVDTPNDGSSTQVTITYSDLATKPEATGYRIKVIATNDALNPGAGNTAFLSGFFAVDRTPPTAPTDSVGAANEVAEGAGTGTVVGVTASSSDAVSPTVTYSLADDAAGRFQIDASSGVVSVANGSLLDYENASSHQITLRATDAADNASDSTLAINVTDVAETLTINSGDWPANGQIALKYDGSGVRLVDSGDTQVGQAHAFASLNGITITGRDNEDDALTVDFSGSGGNPIPAGGLSYDGGTGGNDSLALVGGTFGTGTYNFTNENDGSIDLDGSLISYTGLEPISSTITAANVILNYSGADDLISVSGGVGQTTVDSTAGEEVTFNNPTGSLTIDGGGGDDTTNIAGLGSGFAADLNVTSETIVTSGTVATGGGDVSLTATDGVTVRAAIGTGGGALTVDADSDDDGTGIFTVAAPVMAAWSQQKITASDAAASDEFGNSVSVSGDTAIVGAYGDNGNSGSAYVFTRSSAGWTEQQKLTASDATAGDEFGYSVSVSGDTAIVGAAFDDDGGSNTGSAYVFTRSAGVWSQQAKLTAGDAAAEDYFGYSVSVSGDTAIVGALHEDEGGTSAGSAYIFTRSGGTWTQQTKLANPEPSSHDHFGFSVSVSGDTAIVGVPDDNAGFSNDTGSAFVFTRTGDVWTQQAKLTAADAAITDNFGRSVSVSGDTAIVGALYDDDSGNGSGSAYVFTRSGTVWAQQQKLTAADAAADDYFGRSVSVSGDMAIVGADGNDDGGNGSGSAYVFTRSGTTWTQQQKHTAADAAADDQFGISVSVDGDTAIVGARLGDAGVIIDSGSAYMLQYTTASPGGSISTSGGAVSITAADVDLIRTIDAGSGNITLQPSVSSATVGIGDGSTGTLQIDSTEINNLETTATVTIGRSDLSGDVDIEAIDYSGETFDLKITAGSGSTVEFDGNVTMASRQQPDRRPARYDHRQLRHHRHGRQRKPPGDWRRDRPGRDRHRRRDADRRRGQR